MSRGNGVADRIYVYYTKDLHFMLTLWDDRQAINYAKVNKEILKVQSPTGEIIYNS